MVGTSKKPMLVLMIPFLVLISALLICVLWTVFVSFTDKALIGRAAIDPQFIGLRNYTKLIHHPSFLNSLKVSVIFSVCSGILGQSAMGLFLAVLMKEKVGRKSKSFFEFAILLGWLLPDIVAAFMWGAFASADGFLNAILTPLGFSAVNWLSAKPVTTIIIANIWKGTAWCYLLFTAAIDTIPAELYEAAEADGASGLQKMRFVTLPILMPKILMNLLLITIWTFGYFPLVYGMTGGGPGHVTEILPILMYKEAFESFNIGYGSAISIVMALIVGGFSVIYFIALKRNADVN